MMLSVEGGKVADAFEKTEVAKGWPNLGTLLRSAINKITAHSSRWIRSRRLHMHPGIQRTYNIN